MSLDVELFNKLMDEKPCPAQHLPEWKIFLEMCKMHLEKIEKPIVVELGIGRGAQRKFWEKLLGAEYIGIDASIHKGNPDIHGDTGKRKVMSELKERLKGRQVNVLFIDASHRYENVKRDFELYSPLCSGIIAIHDIERGRYQNIKTREVWKFWDELKLEACREIGENGRFLFLSIHQHKISRDMAQMGIGVVIK